LIAWSFHGVQKPVGLESIVHVFFKNKVAVHMTRRIILRAGATDDAGGAASGKARSTEAKTNTRGDRTLQKNSEGTSQNKSEFL
jgi:hypothetical protein